MTTHRLRRRFSALSAGVLLTGLVAAPLPADAQGLGSGTPSPGPTESQPRTSDETGPQQRTETGTEAITDAVLQVGADSTARNVSWMSESSGGGEVRWAPASELAGNELPDDAQTAETTDSGIGADLSRHFNHATMTDLEPGTEYAYQVGSEEDGFTEVARFTTGDDRGDDEFLVFGDPQIGAGGGTPDDASAWDRTLTSAVATAKNPDFFYSLGDQVNSAISQDEYGQYLAPDPTRTLPQATTIGNHDVSSKAYEQHFNRPNVSADHGGGGPLTSGGDYWFTESDVLFININSNSSDMDAHAEFIDDVVAEHGDQARWTVLGFHHSIYSTATHWDDADVKRLRKAIPPVAARNDIDLVVSGHDHIYNRTFLMDGEGKPIPGADAGREQEKAEGQTLYLTLTSSTGSKFYSHVPGLEWEGKSVYNDVPAFTRVRVSDDALQATTYEVPAGGGGQSEGQAESQAASEQVDDVELTRAGSGEPGPGEDAEADTSADGSDGGVGGSDAEADGTDADAGAGGDADGAGADAGGADGADAGTGADGADASGAQGTGSQADAGAEGDSASADAGTGAQADAGAEAGGDLPRTGGDLGLPVAVGAVAVILGAVLVAAARRRRGAGRA